MHPLCINFLPWKNFSKTAAARFPSFIIKKIRRIAQLKEKAIRDEENGLRHAKEDGIAEGKKLGLEHGKKLGLEEGKKSSKIEIARNLLKDGMNIEKVSMIVGLTKEEIEQIEN